MPKFSSLAGLEVSEKVWVVGGVGGVGWCGFQVTTVSNLNEVTFELL